MAFQRAHAQQYVTFNVPGATFTWASCINEAGETAGYWVDAANVYHGFFRANSGSIINVDPPGSAYTEVTGINSAGTLVGVFQEPPLPTGAVHGFLRNATGKFEVIDFPDARSTVAIGINDAGEITGTWSGDVITGFVRDASGSYTSFTVPGNPGDFNVFPVAINNKGVVAGNSDEVSFIRTAQGKVSFITSNPGVTITSLSDSGDLGGQLIDQEQFWALLHLAGTETRILKVYGSDLSEVTGINKSGTAVGSFFNFGQEYSGGFVWAINSPIEMINVPGCDGIGPNAISSNGYIAGVCTTGMTTQSFVFAP